MGWETLYVVSMGGIIADPQIAQSHRVPYVYPLLPPEFRLIRCSWPRRPRCGPRAPWGCPTSSWRQLHKNRSSRKIHSQRQFSREYDFLKTFSLTENQFSGKTYFYTIRPCSRGRRTPAARTGRRRRPACWMTLNVYQAVTGKSLKFVDFLVLEQLICSTKRTEISRTTMWKSTNMRHLTFNNY